MRTILYEDFGGSMSNQKNKTRRQLSPLMLFLLCSTAALPAFAADPSASGQAAMQTAVPANASVNAIDLLNLMVKRGLISRADADALIKQSSTKAAAGSSPAAAGGAAVATTTTAAATAAPGSPPNDGAMHVQYVPQIVRDQITAEVKQQVMAEAKQENWAAPNQYPDWLQGLNIYGDIRTRYEGNFYPAGNDNTGAFPNFNAINTGSPYDVSAANTEFPPERNVDQNRDYMRLRARLGIDGNLGDGFSTGLRIATGQDDQPVSENQSLGYANNGQGGDFSKYAIWIDRAYIKYEPWKDDTKGLELDVGRFDNPFFSTNMIWWSDLGMDGAAVKGKYELPIRFTPYVASVTPFVTAGAFPVFDTDLNFASNQPSKFASEDKWLYAAQGGADFKINNDYSAKLGAAYYFFNNIEGKLSSPCVVNSAADQCNTDDTRPSFAQNGNTYMALRNIIPDAGNGFGTTNQFQYFGLASPFHELALTGRLDFSHFDPTHLWTTAEFVDNLAFNKTELNQLAVNNRGSTGGVSPLGTYVGGNKGYFIAFNAGQEQLKERWDWNVSVGYRYVESDAVVDAFNDPDFGLGGTNLKGYTLIGNLALSKNVATGLTWMSADSIAGPPFAVDVLMVDLNAKF